jgi:hypothetical protein
VATGRLLSIISLLHPNYIFIKRQSFHVVAGMGKFWAKPSISKFHAIYDLPRFARATTDSRRVSPDIRQKRAVFSAKDCF